MNYTKHILGLVICLLPLASFAEEKVEFTNLDGNVQDLKKELMSLNRDLFILEEELLFPANTQVSVYVSMDVGEYFSLDSVELKLNGKKVSSYLYTEREAEALLRGGVQRLYVGNLKAGDHELVAVFTGMGPNNREYRRGTTLEFDKTLSAKFVELKIEDQTKNMQPEFTVREWD
ncbi:MAG: AraC family transcriptional regulator [Gammaproteobacteria bacterium]